MGSKIFKLELAVVIFRHSVVVRSIGFPQELKEAMKDAKENTTWESKDYY